MRLPKAPNIFRRLVGLSVLLSLSRLTGFSREFGVIAVLGLSSRSDIVIQLLTFPELIASVVYGAGLAYVLVPRLKGASRETAPSELNKFFFLMVFISLILALLLVLLALSAYIFCIDGCLSFAFSDVGVWVWPLVWFLATLSLLHCFYAAWAVSDDQQYLPLLANLYFNLVMLSFLFTAWMFGYGLYFVLLGVPASYIIRGFFMVSAKGRIWPGHKYSIVMSVANQYKQLLNASAVISLWAVISYGVRVIGGLSDEGSFSVLSLVAKAIELPSLMIFGLLSQLLLPRWSASNHDDLIDQRVSGELVKSLVASLWFGFPLVLGLAFFAEFIAQHSLLWLVGSLSHADLMASTLRVASISIPLAGSISILVTWQFSQIGVPLRLKSCVSILISSLAVAYLLQCYVTPSLVWVGFVVGQIMFLGLLIKRVNLGVASNGRILVPAFITVAVWFWSVSRVFASV